jgi:hypothetical protein
MRCILSNTTLFISRILGITTIVLYSGIILIIDFKLNNRFLTLV